MNSTFKKKIVIATDVRFWHRGTGAQQRIYSMVEYLQQHGHEVTTLFCGTLVEPNCESSSQLEQSRILENQLNVLSVLDDWTPNGIVQRAVWKFQCTANWLLRGSDSSQSQSENLTSASKSPTNPIAATKTIDDFESSVVYRRFHEILEQIQPDIVLTEYVTMAWLVPNRRTSQPQWWVDTHDHLSERARQFKQFGHSHWLEISDEEEVAAMAKFDTVIAIQSDEAATFRKSIESLATTTNAPWKTRVIVAGHPRPQFKQTATALNNDAGKVFSLGYFGSDNPSNADAVQWFLNEIWTEIIDSHPNATFLLAGTICNSFPEASTRPGIITRGRVENIVQLYHSFQIAINPVRFGTGLKIKNQEALAFGKPLVVTEQGATGMTLLDREDGNNPILVANDAASFSKHVVGLLGNTGRIKQLEKSAQEYANKYLSPEFVFQELMEAVTGLT